MFERLPRRPSAVDLCAARLRTAILQRAFAPGERLPAERTLAERFGVNRVTVRGALAHLASEHLVRARQGSGYAVRDFQREGGPDLIASLIELAERPAASRALLGDLLLVRRHLARAVVERLLQPHTGEGNDFDPEPIAAAIDALEAAVDAEATTAVIALADLEVARAFVDASGSDVLRLCMNPVAGLLARLPRLARAMFRAPRDNIAAWRLALAAAQAGVDDLAELVTAQLAKADATTLAALNDDATDSVANDPEETR